MDKQTRNWAIGVIVTIIIAFLGFVVTMLGALGGFIWWASDVTANQEALQRQMIEMKTESRNQIDDVRQRLERIEGLYFEAK